MLVHRFSKFLAGGTFVLIAAGGLVPSHEAGLAVPDWPLSYGQWMPPMVGNVRFEHSHRLIAAGVGFLTLVLAGLIWKRESRQWVKLLGAVALLAVILQALLGGATVLYLLPVPVSVFHATLGQVFFALVVCLAYFTSREWRHAGEPVGSAAARRLQRVSLLTGVFILLQLVAGAVVRHAEGSGLVVHLILAFLILVHIFLLNTRIQQCDRLRPRLGRHSLFLAALLLFQLFLGAGAWVYTLGMEKAIQPRFAEVLFATAHQATGALLLSGTALLIARAHRLFRQHEAA